MKSTYPSYLNLYESGELERRIEWAYSALTQCELCPNKCKVNRYQQTGICKSKIKPIISSFNPHHGEEPPISGVYGSGTIFLTHCTMKCLFCQNYPISQLETGKEITEQELADIFIYLQSKKCHNINFVTPTHFMPQILKSLSLAVKRGFHLPLVYNTNGYETIEALHLLDGVIDIYLPDMKYADNEKAKKYSSAKNYVEYNQNAIKEMYRQVGDLVVDQRGIAVKGLMIRHLVLPYYIAGTKQIIDFLKNEVSPTVTLGIMAQYFPAYKALEDHQLRCKVTKEEYEEMIDYAINSGLKNILCQEM